ncbi:MAG: HK97 family phage prohead protease, partial [Caulobacteraceae bacterium]|nr:HK97 family phage prohead protease [Caulobacteraceae bacterium]
GDAGRDWVAGIIQEADDSSAARSVEDKMGIEFRTAKVELRAVDETGMEFEGYAALWDSPSADGTIPEVVKSTAFNRSLSAVERGEWDVRAYQDHDPKLLLGTTKSGTLSLRADAKGLLAKIKLNPEISFHRDLAAIVKSMGNSLGMSFGFWNTAANKVNDDGVRELRDVKLVEVSALTGLAPYYPGTVSLVSVRGLAAKAGVDTDKLRDAVAALLAGEATQDHAAMLASAIAASSRDVEGVPTKFPGDDPVAAPVDEVAPVAEPVAEPVVEDVPPRAVPRAIRERQIALARRAVR